MQKINVFLLVYCILRYPFLSHLYHQLLVLFIIQIIFKENLNAINLLFLLYFLLYYNFIKSFIHRIGIAVLRGRIKISYYFPQRKPQFFVLPIPASAIAIIFYHYFLYRILHIIPIS